MELNTEGLSIEAKKLLEKLKEKKSHVFTLHWFPSEDFCGFHYGGALPLTIESTDVEPLKELMKWLTNHIIDKALSDKEEK